MEYNEIEVNGLNKVKFRSVKLVKVIKVTMRVGEGTPTDPVRVVEQYWNLDGRKLSDELLELDEHNKWVTLQLSL